MSESTKEDQNNTITLEQVLQDEFQVPEDQVSDLIEAIPLLYQGMVAGALQDMADAPLIMHDSLDMEFVEDSIEVDENGLLTGDVVMTSAMVQEYKDEDGKIKRVLKCPDELRKAVDYCRQIPITDEHPPDRMVNDPSQVKGWTDVPTFDEDKQHIVAPIKIGGDKYDAKTLIQKIKDGKTDVSIGFICELDEKEGVFTDTAKKEHKYDAVQRKMMINHMAAGLDKGRGRCPDGVCGISGKDCTNCKDTDNCKNRQPKPEITDGDEEITAAQATPQTGGKCTCAKCGGSFPPDKGLECHETQCPTCTGKGMEKTSQDPTSMDADDTVFNDSDLENIDDDFADLIYGLYEFDEETTDARLTSAQRKELPDDVFCGPNRSFPVNDCAHYTAAKRLLGRYKGEGNKTTILNCIEDRGKTLKCPGAVEEDQAGNYMLMMTNDHTHTVTLDEEGNGMSSTENDHKHNVVAGSVEEIDGHTHELEAAADEEDEPEDEPVVDPPAEEVTEEEPDTPDETEGLEMHKKLMAEKVSAMKSIAEKMSTASDPDEIKKLSESLAALNSYEFRNEELVTLGAKRDDKDDSMDKAAEELADVAEESPEEEEIPQEEIDEARQDLDEAYRLLLDNKVKMVDSIMDFRPLHDRDHYMTMQMDQLKEILTAYVSGKKSPASISVSSAQATDIDDAYAKAQDELDRR